MSLSELVRSVVPFMKTRQEKVREAGKKLSETYPDTPEGTFRCEFCEETRSVDEFEDQRLFQEDGEPKVVAICRSCASENPPENQ